MGQAKIRKANNQLSINQMLMLMDFPEQKEFLKKEMIIKYPNTEFAFKSDTHINMCCWDSIDTLDEAAKFCVTVSSMFGVVAGLNEIVKA